jgi:hypothetical protein
MSLKAASCLQQEFINVENPLLTEGTPILSTEEDENPVNIEQRYETTFSGEVSSCIVGLEMQGNWLSIIKGLAQRMAQKHIESTRQIYNLSKAEARIGMYGDEITDSSPPKKTRTS